MRRRHAVRAGIAGRDRADEGKTDKDWPIGEVAVGIVEVLESNGARSTVFANSGRVEAIRGEDIFLVEVKGSCDALRDADEHKLFPEGRIDPVERAVGDDITGHGDHRVIVVGCRVVDGRRDTEGEGLTEIGVNDDVTDRIVAEKSRDRAWALLGVGLVTVEVLDRPNGARRLGREGANGGTEAVGGMADETADGVAVEKHRDGSKAGKWSKLAARKELQFTRWVN